MNEIWFFILALIPILWLIISLGIFKIPGDKVCPIALVITIILSIFIWKMSFIDSITAALEGTALALWPIMIVIVAAVFTYNLSLYTGSMEIIKKMMTGITKDKRILVLILAWGFGGFLEAIAGFGTAVAIPASIMAGLGFNPLFAAIICLIANTTPTIFGAIGLPVITLAQVANLNVNQLSYAITIQLFLAIVLIPIILVMITGRSVKAIKGVLGITLVSGITFSVTQILVAKYIGPELPAVLGSIISMICTVAVAKIFYKDTSNEKEENPLTVKVEFLAWLPFILVFLIIFFTSSLFPFINEKLSLVKTSINIYKGLGGKPYTFLWLATPGTLIIIATYLGGLIQKAKFKDITIVLLKTFKQMGKSAITIVSIVALAKVMGYSGMIKSIALVLVAATGKFYPIIAPLIGALGTFVTGSDTSANVLFGGLQVEAAKSLGLNPYWLAAANGCGATAGKMISPQSIAVATASTGLVGKEGKILNSTLKFCLVYVIILGLISYFLGNLFGF